MKPTIVHYASGGFVHFLKLLGNSEFAARRLDAEIYVSCHWHKPLGFANFSDIFDAVAPFVSTIPDHMLVGFEAKFGHRISDLRPTTLIEKAGKSYFVGVRDESFYLPAEVPTIPFSGLRVTSGYLGNGATPHPSDEESFDSLLRKLTLKEFWRTGVSVRSHFVGGLKDTGGLIAAHFRNTDRHADLDAAIEQVLESSRDSGIENVFWATDDRESIEVAKERLKGLNFYSEFPFAPGTRKNLHYGVLGTEAQEQFKLALADLWTLTDAQVYLASTGGSGWNRLVPFLRRNTQLARAFFGLG